MNTSNITFDNGSFYKYCKYDEPDSDLEKSAQDITTFFLYVSSILSNTFVIVLAVKYTVKKNLHHLIINMAGSDAIFVACRLWFEISNKYNIEQMYPAGVLGDIICKVFDFVMETSYKVSLLSLMVISIERFRATRRTLQRSRPYTVKERMLVVGLCWVIPMTISGYICYDWQYDEMLQRCYFRSKERYAIYYTIEFLISTIVITITFSLSIVTIRRLSKPQAILAHLNEDQRRKRKQRTRSTVYMVLISTLLYACCWFPAYLFMTLHHIFLVFQSLKVFSGCIDRSSLYYIILWLFPAVNAFFSPFIYVIFLSDFKEAAKRALCCCRKRTIQQAAPKKDIALHNIQQESSTHP